MIVTSQVRSMIAQRPPGIASIAIRLASEGVPIGPIGRALKVPSDVAAGILYGAVQDGMLRSLPPPDWPEAAHAGGAVLQDASRPDQFGIPSDVRQHVLPLIGEFRVPRQAGIILAMLMVRGSCTRTDLFRAIVSDKGTDPKLIDVMICRLRAALDPACLTIETVFGQGYRLDPEVREDLRRRVDLRLRSIQATPMPSQARRPGGRP